MFLDDCKITVKAGDGGDGSVSFHREKYVSQGGPDGGDGGNGGSIIFEASSSMNTLIDFRYRQHYLAENGHKGAAMNCTGKRGQDMIIKVPTGTVIRDAASGTVIADMFADGETRLVLKGGRGGKGNARFATPTRRAPRFAQPGQKTEQRLLQLQLKTIADVGIIGLPNVGKSTLLSALTAAQPKIANYHFTTLTPNLGVVQMYEKNFVLADIPGLIEGAAEGAGLGHSFLRHVERTRMLLHVVDMSGSEGRDPIADFNAINKELMEYDAHLARLPQIVCANKMDIDGAQENLAEFKRNMGVGTSVVPISAAGYSGLDELLKLVVARLESLPEITRFEEQEFDIGDERDASFEIFAEHGVFEVRGPICDNILNSTYADDSDSMRRFHKLLEKHGIIDALCLKGARTGDTVVIGGWEFDFEE